VRRAGAAGAAGRSTAHSGQLHGGTLIAVLLSNVVPPLAKGFLMITTPASSAAARARIAFALMAVALAACSSSQSQTNPQDGSSLPIIADAAAGSCLLEYNSALVSASADPCCYHLGGVNSCNTSVTCNDSSGSGCCLLYATDAISGGAGCCLYADHSAPRTASGEDRTAQCNTVIASGR
jgi:hypothetical protein